MIKTIEVCSECQEDTQHEVKIEVRQESEKYHSREPYRIAECLVCGVSEEQKMNL